MKLFNSFHLKIIALISMIIDHLGAMFFEDYIIFRIIGRIAFILYAFMLVEGYFHTRNIKKYLGKLFLWGLISEIPFDWANFGVFFYFEHQNIFWTLFLSALGIHFLEKCREDYFKVLICSIVMFLAFLMRSDYHLFGVSIILGFYFSRNMWIKMGSISILNIMYGMLSKLQIFGILGLIPIYFYNGERGRKSGDIFYSFYALHLLIFAFIKHLITN